jgi:hypothetical protein
VGPPKRPPNPSNAEGGPGLFDIDHEEGTRFGRVSNLPITEGWMADADIALDGRRLVIMNLTIRPPGGLEVLPESVLTASVLRSVRTSGILSKAYEGLTAQPGLAVAWESFLGEPVPQSRHMADKRAAAALESEATTKKPRGRPDNHYRKVACLYLDLQRAGWGRGILLEIQKRLKAASREQARDWVHGATTRGFLDRGTPGAAGRAPGPSLGDYTPKRVVGPPSKKPATGKSNPTQKGSRK